MSYGWGDDAGGEGGTFSERPKGSDYESARGAYRGSSSSGSSGTGGSHRSSGESRRGHDFRSAKGITPHPIDRKTLAVSTDSTHPMVLCADDTGSFINEIRIILEKLPLLGVEIERYVPGYALCLALAGDTTSDEQPLQVRDFDKGPALDDHIKALYPEGLGGDDPESYDLAAYYFFHHCEMPNAVKPLFSFILDSTTRSRLRAADVKRYIGDDVQSDIDSVGILKKLTEKFTVYVILKDGGRSHRFWAEIVGEQNIVPLSEPRDIVEMVIGIVAGEAGRYEDFEKSMGKRHADRPDRVSRVMESTKSSKMKSSGDSSKGGMMGAKSGSSSGKSMRSKPLD